MSVVACPWVRQVFRLSWSMEAASFLILRNAD